MELDRPATSRVLERLRGGDFKAVSGAWRTGAVRLRPREVCDDDGRSGGSVAVGEAETDAVVGGDGARVSTASQSAPTVSPSPSPIWTDAMASSRSGRAQESQLRR